MSETNSCYVYVLVHVEENKIFYVGRSTQNVDGKFTDRYKRHIRNAKLGCQQPVYRKIRTLLSDKQIIRLEVRATGCTRDEAITLERRLILAIGLDNLTNVDAGWEQPDLKNNTSLKNRVRVEETFEGLIC